MFSIIAAGGSIVLISSSLGLPFRRHVDILCDIFFTCYINMSLLCLFSIEILISNLVDDVLMMLGISSCLSLSDMICGCWACLWRLAVEAGTLLVEVSIVLEIYLLFC